jgi:F0F1-type ATP synthase membrane subunit c/vacuolar-type H+-ATPase subunit K
MDADTDKEWGEDPGWRPSLIGLIPYVGFFLRRRKHDDPITTLRLLYLVFITALATYGFVLSFIAPFRSEHDGLGWAIAIGGLALVNLALVRQVERPLSCESEAALGGSYRTRLFVRLAFAESTALFGFVGAFLINGNWIYFFAVLCSAPAFIRLAPTKAAFIRDQDELTARGCNNSLVAALRSLPPKVK